MKIPNNVLWQLTKHNNSYLYKFNGEEMSSDPLNLTNMHNSQSSGISNQASIGVQAHKEKSKKNFKRVFDVLVKHKQHNKQIKKKKNSQSKLVYSVNPVRREVQRTAKVI